jgi:hypothetical protein
MTNSNEMQNAVALWIEAKETMGSADAVALVALVGVYREKYAVTVDGVEVAVTVRDIVAHDSGKWRKAARDGFFVAFGGFEPGQEIPAACLSGLNRVIRAAILLASDGGPAPTLRKVKANGKEVTVLAGLPFAMCADYPLHDDTGAPTSKLTDLVDREIEFYAERGEEVTREEATAKVLSAPVTLHPSFTSRGKLKPLTRLMADLSKEAARVGLVPAPKGRAPRTSEDAGASFLAALATVMKVMRDVTESDESPIAFTVEIERDLQALARMIDAHTL